MKYNLLGQHYPVSCIGIGGHYTSWDSGKYDTRSGYIREGEVLARRSYIEQALACGINYFDTTFRNEVEMLGKSMPSDCDRSHIFINGMVLGVQRAVKKYGHNICAYYNSSLNERLSLVPGGYFDSVMLAEIEEDPDIAKCDELMAMLQKRYENGDFKAVGFSCHDAVFARLMADRYPFIKTIMVPYNYYNRSADTAFNGYTGSATLIAMKPVVWMAYGVPFCSINNLSNIEELLGRKPSEDVAAHAIAWNTKNPRIASTVVAINSPTEAAQLTKAASLTPDEELLEAYKNAALTDDGIPLVLSAIKNPTKNYRSLYYAIRHCGWKFGIKLPFNDRIPFNELPYGIEDMERMRVEMIEIAKERGYGKYLCN